jgi:hypothetical protein
MVSASALWRQQACTSASGQAFLECLLNDLLQTTGDRATEQAAQQGNIAADVDILGIDPHLDPESSAFEPYLLAIGRPFNAPDQRLELAVHLLYRRFQAVLRLFQGPSMLYRQVDQGHCFSPQKEYASALASITDGL